MNTPLRIFTITTFIYFCLSQFMNWTFLDFTLDTTLSINWALQQHYLNLFVVRILTLFQIPKITCKIIIIIITTEIVYQRQDFVTCFFMHVHVYILVYIFRTKSNLYTVEHFAFCFIKKYLCMIKFWNSFHTFIIFCG